MRLCLLPWVIFAVMTYLLWPCVGAEKISDQGEISSTFARVVKVDAPRSITVKVTSDKTLYIATNDKTEIKKNGVNASFGEIEKDDLIVLTYSVKDNKYTALAIEIRGKASQPIAEPKKSKKK